MYKKMKNSSFMNLLWFLIAILPLLFFAFYSISFFDKEEKEIYYSKDFVNILDFNSYSYSLEQNISVNEDNSLSSSSGAVLLRFSLDLDFNKTYRIYFKVVGDVNQETKLMFRPCTSSNLYNDYLYNATEIYFDYIPDSSSFFLNLINNFNGGDLVIYMFLTDDLSFVIPYDDIVSNNFVYTYTTYKNIYNNFNDYLEAFNNSIFTNGFIANMFISLLNYFNVSSIYLRIFSYYLEYLILISLLHLAFDFVLLVPNICHKFMERIGGERD